MKIIFIGITGVHHVFVAANMFLGNSELANIYLSDNFCDMTKDKIGYPIYLGTDNNDNKVYTLGVGNELKMAERTLSDLREILGFNESELVIFPISIKGEGLMTLVSKLPPFLGLGFIHSWVAKLLINWRLTALKHQIDEAKNTVNDYLNDRA